tara:strand:- start:2962 stop:3648 length:687 start_codon:yes stop_codon:yes gene_type:complete
MIIKTSKHTIDWTTLDSNIKTALVKVSGGADSAIVLYMLCRYITDHHKDIAVVVHTTNDWKKPYQVKWAVKVRQWHMQQFPNIKFLEHETHQLQQGDDYIQGQAQHLQNVYDKHTQQGTHIDITLAGINALPPSNIVFVDEKTGEKHVGPTDDRTGIQPTQGTGWFMPIRNFDKQDIAEIYKQFDLTDTLFDQTRSCEETSVEVTQNFTTHCGTCWWCQERKWGFGRT